MLFQGEDRGNAMHDYIRTSLTFGAFYLLMQIIMFAITIAADLLLGFEITATTTSIVALVTALQLSADRFARNHVSSPRGLEALKHAFFITLAIGVVTAITMFIPGVGDMLNAVADSSVLAMIFGIIFLVHFLIAWAVFPWFVRISLRKRNQQDDQNLPDRF